MLLVHHYELYVFKGGKYRAPCPQHHLCLAQSYPSPFVISLSRRKTAVQHRNTVAEAAAEPVHSLGCKGYFRHQHNCCSTHIQRLGYGLHIYLGLAGACNAVQKELAPALIHSPGNSIKGRPLLSR